MKSLKLPHQDFGGAGPTVEQANENTRALKLLLMDIGYKVVEDYYYMNDLCGIDDYLSLSVYGSNDKKHMIGLNFDRYGFCAETQDCSDDIDQNSVEEIIEILNRKENKTK